MFGGNTLKMILQCDLVALMARVVSVFFRLQSLNKFLESMISIMRHCEELGGIRIDKI